MISNTDVLEQLELNSIQLSMVFGHQMDLILQIASNIDLSKAQNPLMEKKLVKVKNSFEALQSGTKDLADFICSQSNATPSTMHPEDPNDKN